MAVILRPKSLDADASTSLKRSTETQNAVNIILLDPDMAKERGFRAAMMASARSTLRSCTISAKLCSVSRGMNSSSPTQLGLAGYFTMSASWRKESSMPMMLGPHTGSFCVRTPTVNQQEPWRQEAHAFWQPTSPVILSQVLARGCSRSPRSSASLAES